MELDPFIKFAEQKRRKSGKETTPQPKPRRTIVTPTTSLPEGLLEVAELLRADGESFVQEMRFQMQPKAVRNLVEDPPYVDLQKLDKTRVGTVAIHHSNERVAAIVSAANSGSDLKEVQDVAKFVDGFHYTPQKDNVA